MPSLEHLEGGAAAAIITVLATGAAKLLLTWKRSKNDEKKTDVEVAAKVQELDHINRDFVIKQQENWLKRLEAAQIRMEKNLSISQQDHARCRQEQAAAEQRMSQLEQEIRSLKLENATQAQQIRDLQKAGVP